jgi:uncharacterized protein (TIGR03437 family)
MNRIVFRWLLVTTLLVGTSPTPVLAQATGNNPASAGPSPWLSLTYPGNYYPCTVNLLTDGTLMSYGSRFTPDINGSYVNGTWSAAAPLPSGYDPGAFASAVLPDGRLIYEGGEINSYSGPLDFTNLGAIYDPVANAWTSVAPPSGWSTIGGAPGVVLANGTFMMGRADFSGTREQVLLDPVHLTWTPTGNGKADANLEEGWTLLPDGGVLAIDSNPLANPALSERYNPVTGAWASAGSTTVALGDSNSDEMGPQVLRTDGSVIVFGALTSGVDHTAIYHSSSGTWAPGPDLPTINGQPYTMTDAPAALLPSGNVLFAASPSPGHGQTPVHFFEFDGTNMIQVADPQGAASISNEDTEMLVLPTGQIFVTFCDFQSLPQIYTPSGRPSPAWAPSISEVSSNLVAGTTYSISGTQFNGLSQGAMYGDDAQMATNFPLVRITNSATGHVFYCRTHGHSTMGVATGATPVSTNFDVPLSIESGPSIMEVVANGIPSIPKTVLVEPGINSTLPSILPNGIVPVGSNSTTIAPGEWVAIYGTNLAGGTTSWTGNFPTSLGGTSVTIDGKSAYLSYVSATQINVQAPNDVTMGSVSVVVTTAKGVGTSTVTLAQFAPSLFLLDGKHVTGIILRSDGSGAYAGGAYDIIGPTGTSLGYPTVAAKTGDVIALYGTGFGPTSPAVAPGQAFSGVASTINPVQLLINNVGVIPSFAGLSSGGVYQFNLTVPPGLGTGDVPLVANVSGAQTPTGIVISLQ